MKAERRRLRHLQRARQHARGGRQPVRQPRAVHQAVHRRVHRVERGQASRSSTADDHALRLALLWFSGAEHVQRAPRALRQPCLRGPPSPIVRVLEVQASRGTVSARQRPPVPPRFGRVEHGQHACVNLLAHALSLPLAHDRLAALACPAAGHAEGQAGASGRRYCPFPGFLKIRKKI